MEDVVAQVDAFIADADLRPRDQLFHTVIAFLAKGAAKFLYSVQPWISSSTSLRGAPFVVLKLKGSGALYH
jgi:hypothetical protein